jgi:hypothetical protein
MRTAPHLLVAALIASLPAALAQEPQDPAKPAKPPSGTLEKPAAGTEAPALVSLVGNMQLADASGAIIGTIQDHVIDSASGRLVSVVVNLRLQPEGSKSVLVPFTRCEWDDAEKRLVARASAAELATLPEHSQDKAKPDRGEARPAGADTRLPREVSSSQLLACKVKAKDDDLGRAQGLLMDPEHGTIALVLVTTSDSPSLRPDVELLPVPWKAMKFRLEPGVTTPDERAPDAQTEQGCLVLSKPKAELASAPRIKGGDPSVLQDAGLYGEIHRFYGIDPSVAPRRAN